MSNKFVAIDVETANENVSSICQIGLAVFEHGEIIKEWVTLVNPEEDFSAMNVGIHGIKESDVKSKPKFIEIYDELYGYINECICVSHSHFDRVSINRSIEKYSLNKPAVTWLDSARVARRTWTQLASKGYGLYNVCEIIGYKFKHHDALEDAKACGVILHEALKISGKSIAEWLERVELPINSSQKLHYISGDREKSLFTSIIKRVWSALRKLHTQAAAPDQIDAHCIAVRYTKTELSGWMTRSAGLKPQKIDLFLDGHKIASTWSYQTANRPSFRFQLRDIWEYCTGNSIIELRRGRRSILFLGHGFYAKPKSVGRKNPSKLHEILSDGYLFNQFGKLQLSNELNAKWREDVFRLYTLLNDSFTKHTGKPLCVCYGTLLGAVRTKNYISHDHDFDACYLLESTDGRLARAEALNIIAQVSGDGFFVKIKPSTTYFYHPDYPGVFIDSFHLYFGEDGQMRFPFASASHTPFTKEEFSGFTTIELAGKTVHSISDPEIFASRIYGDGWRIPNPGFNWKKDMVCRDETGRFTNDERAKFNNLLGTL